MLPGSSFFQPAKCENIYLPSMKLLVFLLLTLNAYAQDSTFYVRTTGPMPFMEFGPGDDRLGGAKMSYLDSNLLLKVVDSFATDYIVQLSRLHRGYISKLNTRRDSVTVVPPFHLSSSWRVYGDAKHDYISIALDERLPYRSQHALNPSKIIIDIFGVTTNTNWITQMGTAKEIKNTWYEQLEDDVLRVHIELKHKQHWGHYICVQIHGGNGFSDEYLVSKAYRDSRINRIFEGTNEINRLLTVDMVLKRAMKGRIDLMGPAMAVSKELVSIPDFNSDDDREFSKERKLIVNFKKAILMTAGAAVQKLMMKLESEQEILMHIADMAIETYHAESALLRLMKLTSKKGPDACAYERDIVQTFLYDTADRINKYGKDAINSFAEGDEQRMMLLGIKRFTKAESFNGKAARRRIADKLIADNSFAL